MKPARSDAPPASGKRSQRRQAIVETAARLFAEIGYTACEVERVAAEAGIAKGTVYLYFPGKQELFFACVDWGMRSMQEAVRAAAASVPDSKPFDRFGRAIREYLAFFEAHPEYVELLIQERAIFKDRKRPTYFEYRSANIGYWKEQWRQMIASGRIRGDLPVDRITDAIGSLLYGMMFTNHFVGRPVSLDEQYQSIMEIVFRGLLSDREREDFRRPASNGRGRGS